MGAGQSGVAFPASFRFSRLVGIEGVGSVAAIALVLHAVAALTEGLFQWVWKDLVLAVLLHPIPADRMPAFLELSKLFWMALGANLGFNRRSLGCGLLMTCVASDTIHPIFGVFAIHPGLKDAGSVL